MRKSRQYLGAQAIELGRRPGGSRGTAIVRAGHPALDSALTSEAQRGYSRRTVDAMREASLSRPAPGRAVAVEAPARTLGRVAEQYSVTADRQTGTSTTIHLATTRSIVGRDGRRRTLRVWRELAQQSWN